MEVIGDLLPAGHLNVVNGFGVEAGKPLASSSRIAKIAFTGETTTGRLIMQYVSQNILPVTLELGGKSPNIFFEDVAEEQDAFYNKALEGFAMFALNQGEVCTSPSRALVQSSIYSDFVSDAIARVEKIKMGNPLDTETMMGALSSNDQLERSSPTSTSASRKVPRFSPAVSGSSSTATWQRVTTSSRPSSRGTTLTRMRIFQEEIFGPVVSLTSFDDEADALKTANDTLYGLGSGVWSRGGATAYRMGRGIKAAGSGPTATTSTPRMPRSVVTSLRHRPREPQDDARPLPADQEPPGLLLPGCPGLLSEACARSVTCGRDG